MERAKAVPESKVSEFARGVWNEEKGARGGRLERR